MDRRAALKKISVGGVVVVGASAIMSSPAFAFDSPVVTAPPDFILRNDTITTPSNRPRVFRFGIASFGTATCTGSSDQAGGGAEFATFPFADGTFAIGRLSLTANVAGAHLDRSLTATSPHIEPWACTFLHNHERERACAFLIVHSSGGGDGLLGPVRGAGE